MKCIVTILLSEFARRQRPKLGHVLALLMQAQTKQ